MDMVLIIKILMIIFATIYILGLLAVWQYEKKKAKMYRDILTHIGFLKKLGLSMAVLHARVFKIEQDYSQWIEKIDSRQQFIFEKVLFLKKSSLKTEYENDNCLQF